jgi:Ala-tRNA(Pro) deacylase
MEVVMSIPSRLSSYLGQRGARYEIFLHQHSRSSAETARTAHIPLHQLAKSVIVEDDTGCVMAVVPANRNVLLGQLARMLDRKQLRLADEARIAAIFADCDRGAVPALGMPWGVETVVDDELEANEVVYVESGDHERLLRLSNDQFHELMLAARHGHFCGERIH